MSPAVTIVLALALLARRAVAQAGNTTRCYTPNGSFDRDGFPCNVTAANNGDGTSCCRANDVCYSSGICYQGWSGVTYRGTCTDASFKSKNCPSMCLDKVTDGQPWIQQCWVQKNIACCILDDGSCCPSAAGSSSDLSGSSVTSAVPRPTFSWKPGLLVAALDGNGNNYLGEYISWKSTAPDKSPATATATVTAIPLGGASNAASVTACAPAAPSGSHVPSSSSGLSAGQRVGLGLGIPFGILTAAGLLGLAWLLRRLRRERAERLQAEARCEKVAAEAEQQRMAYEHEMLRKQQAMPSPPPPFSLQPLPQELATRPWGLAQEM
ncbi:MAG: hypothetical protein M1826_004069 [Phylliscum demangeonii]|nr:MAG: hypothetical protein M1826_004069 [Phylliscum demangeonii]